MGHKTLLDHLLRAPIRAGFVAVSLLPLSISTVHAVDLDMAGGEVYGSLDTTVSYGAVYRIEDRDTTYRAQDTNGGFNYGLLGRRGQANKNDGNNNFDKGLVSSVAKINLNLSLNYQNYGLNVSGFAFQDFELMSLEGKVSQTDMFLNSIDANDVYDNRLINDAALDYAGQDARLLSAYVWGDFEIGDRVLNVRLGEQVISWGEALFMQDGINQINPASLSALRLPGAEIKEALLPLPMLYMQTDLTDALTVEAFYQFGWENSEADPVGTYYATTDGLFGRGAEAVIVDFLGHPQLDGLVRDYNAHVRSSVSASDPTITRISYNKVEDVAPADDGQFGLAFRYLAESLNNTEFTFYYMNYHSRKAAAGATLGAANQVISNADVCQAARATIGTLAPCASLAGINATAAGIVGGMNAIAYIDNTTFFNYYAEDIELYGLSFTTAVGDLSFAGELAYRPKMPFLPEVGDNLLALNALNAANIAGGLVIADGGFGQHITSDLITDDVGPTGLSAGDTVVLIDESEAVNFSLLTINNFGPRFGLDGLTGVLEVGGAYMADLDDSKKYAGNESLGNARVCATPTSGCVNPGLLEEGSLDDYLDDFSWGYRVVLSGVINDAFAGVNLNPQIRFAHDVEGNSIVGGNFVEDRRSATLALNADYLSSLQFGVSVTSFWGAENRNQIHDRDNAAINVKYSF